MFHSLNLLELLAGLGSYPSQREPELTLYPGIVSPQERTRRLGRVHPSWCSPGL